MALQKAKVRSIFFLRLSVCFKSLFLEGKEYFSALCESSCYSSLKFENFFLNGFRGVRLRIPGASRSVESLSGLSWFEPRGDGGTPYDDLYGASSPERGMFFGVQVY